jgi:hypothetical protein
MLTLLVCYAIVDAAICKCEAIQNPRIHPGLDVKPTQVLVCPAL